MFVELRPDVILVNNQLADLHIRRSSTQSDINQVSHWYSNSPDDGHMAARNV